MVALDSLLFRTREYITCWDHIGFKQGIWLWPCCEPHEYSIVCYELPLIFTFNLWVSCKDMIIIPLDVELYIRQNAQKIKHEILRCWTGLSKLAVEWMKEWTTSKLLTDSAKCVTPSRAIVNSEFCSQVIIWFLFYSHVSWPSVS